MDEGFFNEAMDAVGLTPIYVDGRVDLDAQVSRVKRLHPTLKKCACGFVGTRTEFYNHLAFGEELETQAEMNAFWTKHGEIPYNIGDTQNE